VTKAPVKTNYVLIDFENVQPTDLALLRDGPFKVRVFLGPNQARIPLSLATTLQAFGHDAEYVVLKASGSNALDFHIAYYLGMLSSQEPSAFFHIISKDAGFDPLIMHLKGKGVRAHRFARIAEIPFFKSEVAPPDDSRIETAITHLLRLKAAKPRAQKTLLGTLHALFRKELSEKELSVLFMALCDRGIVKVEGTKVSYDLPSGA
jgi:hypothetical protein